MKWTLLFATILASLTVCVMAQQRFVPVTDTVAQVARKGRDTVSTETKRQNEAAMEALRDANLRMDAVRQSYAGEQWKKADEEKRIADAKRASLL